MQDVEPAKLLDVEEDDDGGYVATATVTSDMLNDDGTISRVSDLVFGHGTTPLQAVKSLVRQGVPVQYRDRDHERSVRHCHVSPARRARASHGARPGHRRVAQRGGDSGDDDGPGSEPPPLARGAV